MALADSGVARFLVQQSPDIYYNEGFRQTIEDHLTWLKPRCNTMKVEPWKAVAFHRDLSSYLLDAGYPLGLHWIIMRLNDIQYNWDFSDERQFLMIPKEDDIQHLQSCYQGTLYSF